VLKAVLDTQIILRGAASPSTSITAQIYAAWNARRFDLLLSDPILHEVEDVLSRSEVLRKLRMTPIEAGALLELLRRGSTRITPTFAIRQSRDADDDKFLECAVAGGADYVVSADADLLSLREVRGIPIVDAPAFWQELRRQA
jgi:putative PIN family toxin of toxin-antitoxin system